MATMPALSLDLIITNRDKETKVVLEWLLGSPSVLAVQAEALGEAIAFLAAIVDPFPAGHRQWILGRTVVLDDDKVGREFVGLGQKLILVMKAPEPGLAERLAADGHHVFAAFGPEFGSPPNVLRLGRPWRHDLEQTLEDMGVAAEKAGNLAAAAGRSLAILRRLMPATVSGRPTWANDPPKALLIAMLAGAWSRDNASDRSILERLSGRAFAELEDVLSPLSVRLDDPLRRSGSFWKLNSLRDAWMLLASRLTAATIENTIEICLEVLSTPSPHFDRSQDVIWGIYENKDRLQPSDELRRGLTEAIIAMAVFSSVAINIPDLRGRTEKAVRRLLATRDERVWWSLSDDFQRLAEASPEAFLEGLDAALSAPEDPLKALFRSDKGLLTPREYLSDLLWALETLAWSPEYLAPAARILARLDERDVSASRIMNRPRNSLRQIFLPWFPQTHADSNCRLRIIDSLVRDFPRTGWTLLLGLAPRGHDTSTPSPQPIWREFATEEVHPLTWQQIFRFNDEVGRRLLKEVGREPCRWLALLEYWSGFDEDWRATAAKQFLEAVPSLLLAEGCAELREELRDLLHHHRGFPKADWSLEEKDLGLLDLVFSALEPTDAASRNAWLFKSSRTHFNPHLSHQEGADRLRDAQTIAAAELLRELDTDAFLSFASGIGLTFALGYAAATSCSPTDTKENILCAALAAKDRHTADIAQGMLVCEKERKGTNALGDRLENALATGHSAAVAARIALALPATIDIWNRLDVAGNEISNEYWRQISPVSIDDLQDLAFAAERLCRVGRARSAVQMLAFRLKEAEPSSTIIAATLGAAARRDVEDDFVIGGPTMFSYYASQLFQSLDADPVFPEKDLMHLEWIYFQVLQHSERSPRRLHKRLAQDPSFFVELLSALYRPSVESGVQDPVPDDIELTRSVASQAFKILHDWSRVPGSDEKGFIDRNNLEIWVREARKLCAAVGRTQIGDQKIGEILAAAEQDSESWPPEAVRDVIEVIASGDVDVGFAIGVANRRGVTVRSPRDGGELERELVRKYRSWARASSIEWPRTRMLLNRIADDYERQAQREDENAEQRDW